MTIAGASGITISSAAYANSLVLDNATISQLSGTLTLTQGLVLEDSYLNLSGGTVVAPSGIGGNNGLIQGEGTIDASVASGVDLNAYGSLTVTGAFNGQSASIGYGVLELGAASSATIDFQGNAGTLKLDDPAAFTGAIGNFALGDTLDLSGLSVSGVSYSGNTLTVAETGGQQLSFTVNGTLTGDIATFASDGNGGTSVQFVMPGQSWAARASGDWSNPANWVSGSVPGATDNVLIAGANDVTITASEQAQSLVLDATNIGEVTETLTLAQGLTLNGSSIYLSGGTIIAPGEINGGGGEIYGDGTVIGNVSGQIGLSSWGGGTLDISGAYTPDGYAASIGPGSTLDLGAASSAQIWFDAGYPSTLKLDDPAAFTGQIDGAYAGDTIDLGGVTATGISYDGTTLTVTEAGGQQLTFAVGGGSYLDSLPLSFASDGNGGTDIQWTLPQGTWLEQARAIGQARRTGFPVPCHWQQTTRSSPKRKGATSRRLKALNLLC